MSSEEKNIWFKKSEIVNNPSEKSPRLDEYHTVIDLNSKNNLLLGTAELGGSDWTGKLWLFKQPEDAPDPRNCIAGLELDVCASCAKFLPNDSQFFLADYSSDFALYDICQSAESCPMYFARIAAFAGHSCYVTALDIDSSQALAITGSEDKSIIVWDIESHINQRHYGHAHTQAVTDISLLPAQQFVFASSSRDQHALIWDTRCDKPATKLAKLNVGVLCVEWMSENFIVFGDDAGFTHLSDVRSKKIVSSTSLSQHHPVKCLRRCEKSNDVIGIAVDEPSVKIMKVGNDEISSLSNTATKDVVRGLAWSSVDGCLYSCGWTGQLLRHSIPAEK